MDGLAARARAPEHQGGRAVPRARPTPRDGAYRPDRHTRHGHAAPRAIRL